MMRGVAETAQVDALDPTSSQRARRCGPPESAGNLAPQHIASGAVVVGGGAAADGPAMHLRWREEIMIHPFETQQNRDVILRSELSRRSMLRGLAATAFAATGLAGVPNAFAEASPAIRPFSYRAPSSALDDLKRRLAQTRWPERETAADWSQGVPIRKLKALVEYWRTG